jgi:hypothetical protein
MDELTMLRKMVEEHDYEGALAIISELDEMAKDDKINKIESFLLVLLIHLIKQNAEQRTTKSWNRSIDNALGSITKSNKRRSAGGHYLRVEEFKDLISETFPLAARNAAYEAFEGIYSAEQFLTMIDADQIKQEAFNQILTYKLEQ